VESKVNVDRPRVANDIPEVQRAIGPVEEGNTGAEIAVEGAE